MRIKTVNITDQVVEYLKENIEAGKWKVGEKIPSENQMVGELGVSRSSIRSALQYLIGIGVLKSYQGKGTFLINSQVENWDEAEYKITSEDCMDIYKVLEFRRILEPGACVLAMENCDEKTIAALETYLEQMKEFKGDRAKFVRADLKFHEVISRTSGNPLLEKSLHKVFLESRKNHEQMNELFGYETGLHFHTEILEAFRERDAKRAHDIMEQHLGGSLETLRASGKIAENKNEDQEAAADGNI